MEPDIFISYASEDRAFVEDLSTILSNRGLSVWKDTSIERVWKREIDEFLDAALLIVVVVTPNSMESAYVTYEWSRAWFKLDKQPYFLHLRDSSVGMATRLRDEFQFHPSSAYLRQGEDRSLTSDEMASIAQVIEQQMQQFSLLKQAASILVNPSAKVEDQTEAAQTLSNAPSHMRAYAGQSLIHGLKHQLTAYGNGEVQVAVLRSIERMAETKAIPYVFKLKSHTSDVNVQSALGSVMNNLLSRVN